jgi:hypothetical protein
MRLFTSLFVTAVMSLNCLPFAQADGFDELSAQKAKLARSPVAAAAATALDEFAADFRNSQGKELTQEFVGLKSVLTGTSATVEIFSLSTPTTLKTDVYGCHLHLTSKGQVEDAHCHFENALADRPFSPAPRSFTVEDFEVALSEAVVYFAAKVDKIETVNELKAWQTRGGIDMIFTHDNPAKKTLLNCHYHGNGIDCHKKTRSGVGEP